MTTKETKMKTYEHGIKDERNRIIGLLTEAGKELYTITQYGNRRDRKKAKDNLLIVANLIDYIEDSAKAKA
jgi:hypothetical protein